MCPNHIIAHKKIFCNSYLTKSNAAPTWMPPISVYYAVFLSAMSFSCFFSISSRNSFPYLFIIRTKKSMHRSYAASCSVISSSFRKKSPFSTNDMCYNEFATFSLYELSELESSTRWFSDTRIWKNNQQPLIKANSPPRVWKSVPKNSYLQRTNCNHPTAKISVSEAFSARFVKQIEHSTIRLTYPPLKNLKTVSTNNRAGKLPVASSEKSQSGQQCLLCDFTFYALPNTTSYYVK